MKLIIIYSYFLEIRNRFCLLLHGWGITAIICYLYKETLLFLLIKPNFFLIDFTLVYFIFTNVTEILSAYIKLIFFITNQIFIFCFLYHVLLFLSPGLYYFEYTFLKQVLFTSYIFSFLSITILNNVILPGCWFFFLSFQKTVTNHTINLFFEAKINEYISFYINLYFICYLNCQMFMILILFLMYTKGDLRVIKKFRKIFYLLFIIFATIITPPDIISQLMLSICIVSIYEVLVYIVLISKQFNLEAN